MHGGGKRAHPAAEARGLWDWECIEGQQSEKKRQGSDSGASAAERIEQRAGHRAAQGGQRAWARASGVSNRFHFGERRLCQERLMHLGMPFQEALNLWPAWISLAGLWGARWPPTH